MATAAANKRLAREYKTITANPPPYITAHPSEHNILEWHYIITGPPDTPYANGQYWGTLHFPPDYPFKPPAIRMITPSGRFQPSTRLCLSISDFHPKSFNPAWEVSTILIGLLSFMTSEEMTTGSVNAGETERKRLAARSRWWNSTGGGSARNGAAKGNVGSGDAGKRFREQWPELDKENWEWMKKMGVDAATGGKVVAEKPVSGSTNTNVFEGRSVHRRGHVSPGVRGDKGTSVEVVMRGESWVRRHRVWLGLAVLVVYVLLARALE
ncbi:UBC-like protein [Ascodesmis nigricans]|uniref:UBC-like protein n=1 Tax=Ascodesmis nigricans TaxID=341454 RepID=A0A4S2MZM2_9PEZI|nr:UBC-like protein [Ascodesmis nigricans]